MSNLGLLFPKPSLPPSKLSPFGLPTPGPSAVNTLRSVLQENYVKHHVFFNERRFHNHAIHRALALYSLGSDGAVIQAGFDKDRGYQRPAFKSPNPITESNFQDHLGDEKYYNAYLEFFSERVLEKGTVFVLEKYIFSSAFNSDTGAKPNMLNRFLSGLLHPLIHVGYGVEFGLPGIVAEGLAQTAVHETDLGPLIPASDFASNTSETIDALTSRFGLALALEHNGTAPPTTNSGGSGSGTHAFTILARMLKDPQFDERVDMFVSFRKHGPAVRAYASQWSLNTQDPAEVERKIEELVWANVLIYGVGGWAKDAPFKADFVSMHFVTSSLFLSSVCAYLTPSSQALLLRNYFNVCLAFWISRGRPTLDITNFFSTTTTTKANPYPLPAGPLPTPSKGTLLSSTESFSNPAKAITPNPWLPLLETSVVHPDEHLPKLQRALAHFAHLYGHRGVSSPSSSSKLDSENGDGNGFEGTELEGVEKLDGTLFLRAAGLTAERMGRSREGQEVGPFWDREGLPGSE